MDKLNDKYVVNLSHHLLTIDQRNVLSFGLNFCPTPNSVDAGELRTDLDRLHRKLRLESRFKGEDTDICDLYTEEENNHASVPFANRKFKVASNYNPVGPPCLEAMIISNERDFNKRGKFPQLSMNISPNERKAIRELRDNQKIVIKPADKGSATVILNREDYLAEGLNNSLMQTSIKYKIVILQKNTELRYKVSSPNFISREKLIALL